MSNSVHRQTCAAWKVFLKRPLAILILLSLFSLVAAVFFALCGFMPNGGQQSNAPKYTGAGKALRDTDDIRRYFNSGETDKSIVGLDFTGSGRIESADLTLRSVQDEESGQQIVESIPFADARPLFLQFPNVQWIRFIGQQLRGTGSDVLKQMHELRTIGFITFEIDASDIEILSQITSLERIKISALRCDAGLDLSPLQRLPNLRSVHVVSGSGSPRDRTMVAFFTRRHVAELAKLPHLQELILESDDVATGLRQHVDRLADDESKMVAEFANDLSSASHLRTLYVGRQNSGAQRQALRELRDALPHVSVRPALYNMEVGGILVLGCFAGGLCLWLAGVHLVSSCTLPQTGVVPGVESAHRRVFAWVVLITMLALFWFLVLVAGIHALPAVSLCLAVSALGLMLTGPQNSYVDVEPKQNHPVRLFVGFAPIVVVLGAMWRPDRLEWFMFGEQPVVATVIIVVSLFAIYRTSQGIRDVYRQWAENGVEPGVSWQEFIHSLSIHYQQSREQAMTLQGGSVAQSSRAAVAWSERLQQLQGRLGTASDSLLTGIELWAMGTWQIKLSKAMLTMAVLLPGIFMPVVLILDYVGERLSGDSPSTIVPMFGYMLLLPVCSIGISLYTRYPMFASEIMRPVRRSGWRDTTLLSTLLLSVFLGSWSWLIIFVIRFALGQNPGLLWLSCSFSATVAFCVLGAAVAAWVVIVRRTLFTAACVLLLLLGFMPVGATITEGHMLFLSVPFPATWLCIVAVQLCVGGALFAFAWRRWMEIEPAIS